MSVATGATKLLSLAAATADTTSADWNLPWGATGAIFVLDLTAVTPGATGATFRIQGKDETSGKYYQINATPAAVNATGTTVYVVYPSAGTVPGSGSGITAVTNTCFLPPTGNVVFKVTDGTFTGTVSMTPIMP